MSDSILAIDRGKYKSVACLYRAVGQPSFTTLACNPETLLRLFRLHRPRVTVIEACLLAGWVHDLFVSAGFDCKVANTASDAWKFRHTKRKTGKDDSLPSLTPSSRPGWAAPGGQFHRALAERLDEVGRTSQWDTAGRLGRSGAASGCLLALQG